MRMNTKQVADYLCLTESRIIQLVKKGELKAEKRGKSYMYTEQEVKNYAGKRIQIDPDSLFATRQRLESAEMANADLRAEIVGLTSKIVDQDRQASDLFELADKKLNREKNKSTLLMLGWLFSSAILVFFLVRAL